jgi:hypothetical protein
MDIGLVRPTSPQIASAEGTKMRVRVLTPVVLTFTLASAASCTAKHQPSPPTTREHPTSTPSANTPAGSSVLATAPGAPTQHSQTASRLSPIIDRAIEVYANCQSPSFEPSAIVLTCADHGVQLQELHWTIWTATGATATGVVLYNDCTPSCASGRFHTIPGTHVELSAPVRGATGEFVWSRINFNPQPPGYAAGPYHGGPEPLPIRPD